MKIMQVVHGLPSRARFGTQIYASSLSGELSRRHNVWVVCAGLDRSRRQHSAARSEDGGAQIVEIANNPRFLVAMVDPLISPQSVYKNENMERVFDVLLEEIRPDVVHFQHVINFSASLIPLCKRKGIPVVLNLHDFWFVCHHAHLLRESGASCPGPIPDRPPDCIDCLADVVLEDGVSILGGYVGSRVSCLNNRLSRTIIARLFALFHGKEFFVKRNVYLRDVAEQADVIITPSCFLRDRLVEFGIPEDSILVSHNGMNPAALEGLAKHKSDSIRFGVVSPILAPYKGIHLAVEAFANLGIGGAELLVWGNYNARSPYYRALQRMSSTANVRFMGGFTDVGVPYSQMDVLIVPSICHETFSLVLHEAFMARIPAIASNVGALPEFVKNDENGLVFEAGNAADLRDKMRLIVDSPSLISRYAANITPPRTIAEQVRELEGIYEEIIRNKATGPGGG